MLGRRLLLSAAVVALLAVAFLLAPGDRDDPVAGALQAAAGETAGTTADDAPLAGRVELLPEEDGPVAPEPRPELEPSASPTAMLQGYGSLAGTVYGADGLPARRLALTFTSETSERVEITTSDDEGRYLVERLPVGTYSAEFLADDPMAASRQVALVDVFEGENLFDIHLFGSLALTGACVVSIEERGDFGPGVLGISVELRRRWDGELVGTAIALEEDLDPPRAGFLGLLEDRNPDPPPRPPGHFRFEGLEPIPYVLRYVVGNDAETGEPIFVERDVSLANGDVELEPEEWTLAEFVAEASSQR